MVLYELKFEFNLFMLVPVVMLLFFVFFPGLLKNGLMGKEIITKYSEKHIRIFQMLAIMIVLFCAVIGYWRQFDMYCTLKNAYDNGKYKIVEGSVENFVPMPYEGHSNESFDIGGIHFEYSDYEENMGYNNAKSHGGVICGNGQLLKIGYVDYGLDYGNIIVYIEEIK